MSQSARLKTRLNENSATTLHGFGAFQAQRGGGNQVLNTHSFIVSGSGLGDLNQFDREQLNRPQRIYSSKATNRKVKVLKMKQVKIKNMDLAGL